MRCCTLFGYKLNQIICKEQCTVVLHSTIFEQTEQYIGHLVACDLSMGRFLFKSALSKYRFFWGIDRTVIHTDVVNHRDRDVNQIRIQEQLNDSNDVLVIDNNRSVLI